MRSEYNRGTVASLLFLVVMGAGLPFVQMAVPIDSSIWTIAGGVVAVAAGCLAIIQMWRHRRQRDAGAHLRP
jgi:F0F1-type ATP synthase assembly protein I